MHLICFSGPLVLAILFTLWMLVEYQDIHNDSLNITVWPTFPKDGKDLRRSSKLFAWANLTRQYTHETVLINTSMVKDQSKLKKNHEKSKIDFLPPALHALKSLVRLRREGKKPSRRDRKVMAKHGITTTTRKWLRRGPTKRAYTLDINSEDYSIKKHGNFNANPAQYMYEVRMSASQMIKSILVKDVRKQFFNITEHRTKLSQLEILKNQSRPLYDNYLKIINKSTTINWWRKLRDARYNNTSPLNIDPWATLDKLYESWDVYGGTTDPTEMYTVAASLVKFYKTAVVRQLSKIPPGPVIYEEKDVLGSSGIVSLDSRRHKPPPGYSPIKTKSTKRKIRN